MKKMFFLSAAALALAATSCSQEDAPFVEGDGTTTLTVNIPDNIGSRFGEGETVDNLFVAIYKHEAKTPLFSNFTGGSANGMIVGQFEPVTIEGVQYRQAKVNVALVKGTSYDIICWAQKGGSTGRNDTYTFDAEKQTITVNYGTGNTIDNYDENRDAFYGQALDYTSTGAGVSITLTRPFAQINVGTADWEKYKAAGGNVSNAFGMTISGVANTLNLNNGTITAPETTTTVTVAPATVSSEAFPAGADYKYLAMAYVLANQNLTVTLTGISPYDAWSAVPAKVNYRTNIFGNLLTNAEDFTITLSPGWAGEDENYDVGLPKWDGTTPPVSEELPNAPAAGQEGEENPTVDPNVFELSTPDQLALFAAKVNGGESFAGKTVKLTSDMDLNNQPWTPIGLTSTHTFNGIFDGQGHTIKNVNVKTMEGDQNYGLFGTNPYRVQNVNIDGFTATATPKTFGHMGTIAGNIYMNNGSGYITNCNVKNVTLHGVRRTGGIAGWGTGVIENCTVTDLTIVCTTGPDGENDKVGGIIGQLSEANSKVINCTVTNALIIASRNIGGIVGATVGSSGFVITGNTVTNAKLYWTLAAANLDWASGNSNANGPIIGRLLGTVTLDNNTTTDVTVSMLPEGFVIP